MESPNLETDLNDPDFINILNGILSEKLKYNNYQFICELCQNKNVKNNLQKRNIALEVALNKEVDIMTTNSNLYPHAVNVLGDKDILSLDSTTYRKVVSTAIVNIQAYPLYIALKQENLTPKKKKAIIDYYYEILDKHLQKYLFVDINDTSAYRIQNGIVHNIINKDYELIDTTEIDDCSSVINSLYDKLVEVDNE